MFVICLLCFFFFKQKTAYEMRISDWSSDVCSSDLGGAVGQRVELALAFLNLALGFGHGGLGTGLGLGLAGAQGFQFGILCIEAGDGGLGDRKSTRLNSSH